MVSGKPIDIEAGPNWDDDLSGSPIYAANDPNFKNLTEEEKNQLFEIERMMFFYLPRICNHCLNPGCVAACPSGAIYKRGEDGIVLVDQTVCRAWRMCVSSCPYKKVYYNWSSGKSGKCILCYPRLETGQAPACFHSCVGRIRYLGVLFYDADRIPDIANANEDELVQAQKEMILAPHDDQVIARAKANGIKDDVIKAAQQSPVYKFVKQWDPALPLRPEFRTLPMLFYVLPMKYLAKLLSAGNDRVIEDVYKKLMAVRLLKRLQTVGDVTPEAVAEALKQGGTTEDECEAIYKLTSLPTFEDRFVIPPMSRESAMEDVVTPFQHKAAAGTGFRRDTSRRW